MKVYTATVLHKGWEMDNELWVVQDDDGCMRAMTTNHGSECDIDIKGISDLIAETKESLDQLINAERILIEDQKAKSLITINE